MSTEAIPPPAIKSPRAMPSSDRGYSSPLLLAKNLGQCTPKMAVAMTHAMKKAAGLVKKPRMTRHPPISSEKAAAPSHSHDGRMNPKGAFPETNLDNPGPSKVPSTFWTPCAMQTAPSANRSGTVAHVGDVEKSFRIIS